MAVLPRVCSNPQAGIKAFIIDEILIIFHSEMI